jgi:hypothetical protein
MVFMMILPIERAGLLKRSKAAIDMPMEIGTGEIGRSPSGLSTAGDRSMGRHARRPTAMNKRMP